MLLETILKRLKNPSVLISLISQIFIILSLFKIDINRNILTDIIAAIWSISTILGILSNPDTQTKGYGDDLLECKKCCGKTEHIMINNNMVCKKCGEAINKSSKQQ